MHIDVQSIVAAIGLELVATYPEVTIVSRADGLRGRKRLCVAVVIKPEHDEADVVRKLAGARQTLEGELNA